MSDSLWPHGLQHTRLLCPSLSLRVDSDSCPLSQWCHPTISSSVAPFPPALSLSQHQCLFQWVGSSYQMGQVLEFQHQWFQWILKVDFLLDWLVWSPCCPMDSQEFSPAPQYESINFSALSLLYSQALTFIYPGGHTGATEYPGSLDSKESAWNAGDQVWSLGLEDPLEKKIATPPLFLPREFHEQRSLAACRLWVARSRIWLSN